MTRLEVLACVPQDYRKLIRDFEGTLEECLVVKDVKKETVVDVARGSIQNILDILSKFFPVGQRWLAFNDLCEGRWEYLNEDEKDIFKMPS